MVDWPHELRHDPKNTPLTPGRAAILELGLDEDIVLTPVARRVLEESNEGEAVALLGMNDPRQRWSAVHRFANASLAPGWVSAQLWREAVKNGGSVEWWLDRDVLFQNGTVAPDDHWTGDDLRSLCDAILGCLEAERDLLALCANVR
jgi:hypothetical protein